MTDLGAGSAPASAAMHLNSSGDVVGHTYEPSTGATEPVVWNEQTMGALPPLADDQRGRAFQINDRHQVIGALDGDGGSHAAFWEAETGTASVIRPDARFSAAVDLNDRGEVLIWYLADGPEHRITIWRDGHERSVWSSAGSDDASIGARLRPVALNSRGEAALTLDGPDGTPEAGYHWFDGQLTDIGSLGGGGTVAHAIDEHGWVAGTSLTAEGDQRAFIWQDGTMHDLGTLDGATSQVVPTRDAMSDAGHVIGTSSMPNGEQRGFIWFNDTMHDLGTLGGGHVEPMAVNDRGQVVGHSLTGDGRQHGFFWDGEEMIDLGTLGGDLSQARALNEKGQVVGHSQTANGDHHAVAWRVSP